VTWGSLRQSGQRSFCPAAGKLTSALARVAELVAEKYPVQAQARAVLREDKCQGLNRGQARDPALALALAGAMEFEEIS